MTDIIASPAVKEAVKIVMEQQERLGKNAAEAVSAAATASATDVPGASQRIRTASGTTRARSGRSCTQSPAR